jgi:hypothetical protein
MQVPTNQRRVASKPSSRTVRINTGVLKMQAQRKDANAVEKHRIS